jgi:hypothetical protein
VDKPLTTKGNDMSAITIYTNEAQLSMLKIGLELEIKTELRMQMSKESSLKAFKRITGIDTGKGLKGREKALEIVHELLFMKSMEDAEK